MIQIDRTYDVEADVTADTVYGRLLRYTAPFVKKTDDLLDLYGAIADVVDELVAWAASFLPGGQTDKVLIREAADWRIFFSLTETNEEKRAYLRERLTTLIRRGTEAGMQAELDLLTQSTVTISTKSAGETGWVLGRTQPAKTSEPVYTYLGMRRLIIVAGTNMNNHYSAEELKAVINDYLAPAHVDTLVQIS